MLFSAEAVEIMPGWFSLLIQSGSFGVIVYFLVYALPKMRREIADERRQELDTFREDVTSQRQDFTRSLDGMSGTFREESRAERLACEKHFSTLAESNRAGSETTVQAIKAMSEQVTKNAEQTQRHSERNQQMIDLMRQALRSKGIADPTEDPTDFPQNRGPQKR